MPRTSPTFQSRFGLSGWVLWQPTQTSPIRTGRRDPHLAVEDRAGHLDHRLAGIGAQGGQGAALERVERVPLAPAERQVGDEAVLHRAVMRADPVAELDRQGGGDRDGARHLLVVGRAGGHLAVRLEHAADDVAGVEAAHVVDDPAGLAGLQAQQPLGQAAQVEPDGDRQAQQAQEDRRHQQGSDRALLARGLIGQFPPWLN